MAALLTPNEILSLSAQAARRLLTEGDGDAALLYLALLEAGGDGQRARAALRWDYPRLAAAHGRLARLELVAPSAPAAPPAAEERAADTPPEYSRSDILSAMEGEAPFRPLCRAVESCLGRPLSETDLKSLYTIYDFLSLPPEVILLLAHWCALEAERRYGPGRRPRMGELKKEAFRWKRLGVDTVEAAEDFLRRQQELAGRERELLPLLDIRGRQPVAREREYLSAWVEMGFADDAIRLAYERTVFQKGQLNWPYMNSILKRWHAAGLHTAAEAAAGDARPRQPAPQPGKPSAAPAPRGDDRRGAARQLKRDVDWMEEFLREQKG